MITDDRRARGYPDGDRIERIVAVHTDRAPAYGPAENSIMTTTHVVRHRDVHDDATDIPIGKPIAFTTVAILDDEDRRVTPGVTGELVIAGHGVALAYLGDPAETARRFSQVTGGQLAPRRYYRTGDRAREDAEGLLRFQGRFDRAIKLNGIRIEPGEIEAVLESHPLIAVILIGTENGREQLARAYATADGRPLTGAGFRRATEGRLLATMVPSIACHTDQLPMGSTGKVNLAAVRQLIAARVGDAWPLKIQDDSLLAEIGQLLGQPLLAVEQDLLNARMTSLDAVRLATRLTQRWCTSVTALDVFRLRTVAALHRLAAERTHAPKTPIFGGSNIDDEVPLTRAQRRFLFSESSTPGDEDNMVAEIYLISGPLDSGALEEAIRRVMVQHPLLRTTFPLRDGVPVQRLMPLEEIASPLTVVGAPQVAGASLREVAQRFADGCWGAAAFRLNQEPPLRTRVCRLGDDRHLFAIQAHHSVIDGRSEIIVLRDVTATHADVLAGRSPRPVTRPAYADFGAWERENVDRWIAEGIPHWRQVLGDAPPSFLPPPPVAEQAPCRTIGRSIDAQTGAWLSRAASRRGGPSVSGLITATALALKRTLSVSDMCLGMVTDRRMDPEFDDVVGYIANPVVVSVRAASYRDPGEVLAATAATVLAALQHAMTPFDEVVRILRPPRARHPWFQALTLLQGPRPSGELAPGTTLVSVPTQSRLTRREWTVQAFPDSEGGWRLVSDGRQGTLDDATAGRLAEELESAVIELSKGR